jgi:hypothetical protein
LSRLGYNDRQLPLEIAAHAKQGSAHHWKFSKVHAGPQFAHSFNILCVYNYITKLCRQQAEVVHNHENEHVRDIGQSEARHRIYSISKIGIMICYVNPVLKEELYIVQKEDYSIACYMCDMYT